MWVPVFEGGLGAAVTIPSNSCQDSSQSLPKWCPLQRVAYRILTNSPVPCTVADPFPLSPRCPWGARQVVDSRALYFRAPSFESSLSMQLSLLLSHAYPTISHAYPTDEMIVVAFVAKVGQAPPNILQRGSRYLTRMQGAQCGKCQPTILATS